MPRTISCHRKSWGLRAAERSAERGQRRSQVDLRFRAQRFLGRRAIVRFRLLCREAFFPEWLSHMQSTESGYAANLLSIGKLENFFSGTTWDSTGWCAGPACCELTETAAATKRMSSIDITLPMMPSLPLQVSMSINET